MRVSLAVMLLLGRLDQHARLRSNIPAFVDAASGISIDWQTLARHAEALAVLLRAKVPAESVVLIQLPNDLSFPVAFFAALLANCRALLISTELPAGELVRIANMVQAAVLITAGQAAFDPQTIPLLIGPADFPKIAAAAFSAAESPSAAIRLMLQSSGSTGKPKIVCRSAESIDAVCQQMVGSIHITVDDRVLATVPLCHSYGIEHGLLAPVWAGATVRLCRGLDLPLIHNQLLNVGITVLPGVPSMFEMLANLGEAGTRYPVMKAVYSAGAPLPAAVARDVFDRCGLRISQLYGATEIGSVTFRSAADPNFEPASVGCAMPGVTVQIADGDQVLVHAPSMFSGYFGEPPFAPGFYHTGDIGRLDAHGNLFITGRATLLIDIGGLKVNPLEVEEVLRQHPTVGDCVVIALRQSTTVLRLKAVITPRHIGNAPDIADIRRFARQKLSGYKVPRVFEVRDSLPRTQTGKIIRHLVEG